MVPHLGHTGLAVVAIVVGAGGVYTCENWSKVQRNRGKCYNIQSANIFLHAVSLELTFAGFHALKPSVISVFVAGSPTVPKPSTARSAATDSAGFLERAAFWARHRVSDR